MAIKKGKQHEELGNHLQPPAARGRERDPGALGLAEGPRHRPRHRAGHQAGRLPVRGGQRGGPKLRTAFGPGRRRHHAALGPLNGLSAKAHPGHQPGLAGIIDRDLAGPDVAEPGAGGPGTVPDRGAGHHQG